MTVKDSFTILLQPPNIQFMGKGGNIICIELPLDLSTGEVITPDVNWQSELPAIENGTVSVVIPYYLYANKNLYGTLLNYLSEQLGTQEIIVIPDVYCIAQKALRAQHKYGLFRLIQAHSDHFYVHRVIVNRDDIKFEYSKRFDWGGGSNDPEALPGLFKLMSDNAYMEEIFNDEFKHLESRHYCYRIDYDSEITYHDIHQYYEQRSMAFGKIAAGFAPLPEKSATIFLGPFGTNAFFRHYFNIQEEATIGKGDFKSLLEQNLSHVDFPTVEDGEITLKLYSDNEILQPIPLYSTNMREGLLRFRLLEENSDSTETRLSFVAVQKPINYSMSPDCSEVLKRIPLLNNGLLSWRQLGISYSIDLCDNLVINWYNEHKKVFAEITGKI